MLREHFAEGATLEQLAAVRVDDLERDPFDDHDPIYLIDERDGAAVGSARFLRTTGPNMLRDVFSDLVDPRQMPASDRIWECSRFAVDERSLLDGEQDRRAVAQVKGRLLVACHELALHAGVTAVVAELTPRVLDIWRRAGCIVEPLGPPKQLGAETVLAGIFQITPEALDRVRAGTGVSGSVLSVSRRAGDLHPEP